MLCFFEQYDSESHLYILISFQYNLLINQIIVICFLITDWPIIFLF